MGLVSYSVAGIGNATASYSLLARKGQFLTHAESAFLAEAAALEWALQYLVKLLKGTVAITQEQQQQLCSRGFGIDI